MEQKAEKKEGRGKPSETQKKTRAMVSTRPLTPRTHTERLVGRTEPRVKGERKGLFCAFHPSGAQRHIGTSIPPHKHMLTHMHMHTHTHLYLLEGGSDLSLCARPTRKQRSALGVFHDVEEPLWKRRLVAWRFAHSRGHSAPL